MLCETIFSLKSCALEKANLLLTGDGVVKLADFGVAIETNGNVNNDQIDHDVAGSPYWMAPEVIQRNPATTACDIWAVGVTAIELFTGHPPYASLVWTTALHKIVRDPPDIPASASEGMKEFLCLCLEKEPSQRPTAEALQQNQWLIFQNQLHATSPQAVGGANSDQKDEEKSDIDLNTADFLSDTDCDTADTGGFPDIHNLMNLTREYSKGMMANILQQQSKATSTIRLSPTVPVRVTPRSKSHDPYTPNGSTSRSLFQKSMRANSRKNLTRNASRNVLLTVPAKAPQQMGKWTVGQKCDIYINLQQKWIEARVIDLFNDEEGDWVKVRFGRNYKDIRPDSSEIRSKVHLEEDIIDDFVDYEFMNKVHHKFEDKDTGHPESDEMKWSGPVEEVDVNVNEILKRLDEQITFLQHSAANELEHVPSERGKILVTELNNLNEIFQKSPQIITQCIQTAIIPIMAMLSIESDDVRYAALKVMGTIIADEKEGQQHLQTLCLVQLIPAIGKLVRVQSVKIKAAVTPFLRKFCEDIGTTSFVLPMFIASGGIGILVECLWNEYNDDNKKIIFTAVDCIHAIVESEVSFSTKHFKNVE